MKTTPTLLPIVLFVFSAPLARAADDRVTALVTQQIKKVLPDKLELAGVHIAASHLEDASDVAITWVSPAHKGTMSVAVTLTGKDGARRRVFAEVRFIEKHRMLVAKRVLEKGAIIGAGDLSIEERTSEETRGLDLAPDALIGRMLREKIEKNAPVFEEAIDLPPAIARGTPVRILVQKGVIQVSTSGVLEKAARLGEPSSARAQGTLRSVQGRLISSDTFVVSDGGAS